MIIKRYTSEVRPVWDEFVRKSRNGTFLFERAYMDYHRDRFEDHSLMYFDNKNRLIALLPGCAISPSVSEKVYSSHSGLTYGGFVLAPRTRSTVILDIFSATKDYLKTCGFSSWLYKQVPSIYHRIPSEEDEYALWMNNAKLEECNLSIAIDLQNYRLAYSNPEKERRRRIAIQEGFVVNETDDYSALWPIVESLLKNKYGVAPVHSLEEITMLHKSFPNNIRCFEATLNGKVEAGIVVYESNQVAHSQYSEATDEGMSKGAVVFLVKHLIDYYISERPGIRYFDFGISNEEQGCFLNKTLASFKEEFGGRGVACRIYRITL